MACLNTPVLPASSLALPPLDAINRELEAFFADWDADGARDGATWLTLERTRALGALLDQGRDALARALPGHPVVEQQRRQYGTNLRRLQPLLLLWQRQMMTRARRLERERAHQQALSCWLRHQPGQQAG